MKKSTRVFVTSVRRNVQDPLTSKIESVGIFFTATAINPQTDTVIWCHSALSKKELDKLCQEKFTNVTFHKVPKRVNGVKYYGHVPPLVGQPVVHEPGTICGNCHTSACTNTCFALGESIRKYLGTVRYCGASKRPCPNCHSCECAYLCRHLANEGIVPQLYVAFSYTPPPQFLDLNKTDRPLQFPDLNRTTPPPRLPEWSGTTPPLQLLGWDKETSAERRRMAFFAKERRRQVSENPHCGTLSEDYTPEDWAAIQEAIKDPTVWPATAKHRRETFSAEDLADMVSRFTGEPLSTTQETTLVSVPDDVAQLQRKSHDDVAEGYTPEDWAVIKKIMQGDKTTNQQDEVEAAGAIDEAMGCLEASASKPMFTLDPDGNIVPIEKTPMFSAGDYVPDDLTEEQLARLIASTEVNPTVEEMFVQTFTQRKEYGSYLRRFTVEKLFELRKYMHEKFADAASSPSKTLVVEGLSPIDLDNTDNLELIRIIVQEIDAIIKGD